MNEARDSLQSRASLALVDLLGEGPIGGLVNGLRSIYLNDTPIENADGTRNFQNVQWDMRGGTNDQGVMPYFGNYVEAPYGVSAQVKTTTPYTFTISNPDADAVRVIVSLPALMRTDGGSGDINGTTVEYKFSMSVNGGSFVDVPMAFRWDRVGSWALNAGYQTATAQAGYQGVRATIVGHSVRRLVNTGYDGSYYVYDSGPIVVQAQEFNGTSWQNLGPQKTLNVSWTYVDVSYEVTNYVAQGDSHTVESVYNNVRFVIVSKAAPGLTLSTGVIESKTPTPTITISGKTRSRYQRAHVLKIPQPNSSVSIRMTRLTADSTSSLLQNETYIDSYSEIVTLNMNYPNSAVVGLRLDSQQFNSVPNRSYLVDGLYIRVPTNYDPVARTYSGVWNGQFKTAVSNNPAWVMFDVLTNKRYGLGQFIDDSQVDKAMLYTIGRYCDEMVPNGFGGVEPRFTLNTLIQSQQESFKLVSDIASVFRGMGFWSGGMVSFTYDSPSDAVGLYTNANVIDGIFNYTGSSRKDRNSVVHVTWNDPEDNYRKRVEYVEDPELIALYGVKKLDTLAFGCTSRGQAARVGKWILYTQKYESDTITFNVGLDSAFLAPGNIIKIHDSSRAGKRSAGRLISCTTTSATLDAEVDIASLPATISLMMPSGQFVDRTLIQGVGKYQTVTWATPLTELPVDNALWMVSEPNLEPILARVLSISQTESKTHFEISAVEHNPSKYNAIEQGLQLQERKTSIIDAGFVEVPAAVTVTESQYRAAPGVFANRMSVGWMGDSTQYELAWRGTGLGNRSNFTTVRLSGVLTYDIDNVGPGPYEILITGINPLGKRSRTVTTTYTVVGNVIPPANVAVFNAVPNAQGIELTWTQVPDEDVKAYELRSCSVAGQSWEAATPVTTVAAPTGTYQLPPRTAGTYEWLIKAVDTANNYSVQATRASATIVLPGSVVPSASYSLSDALLSWSAATAGSLPIKEYIVKRGANWATATEIGRSTDTRFRTRVTWNSSQTFWVAAVDAVGNEGVPASTTLSFSGPSTPVLSSVVKSTSYTISWADVSSSLPLSYYEVRFGSSFASGSVVGRISGVQLTVPINWTGSRTFWVAAVDVNGNVGTAGSVTQQVLAPNTPSGISISYEQNQATISWSDATRTLPIDFYEVRRGASFATGTLVAKAYATALTVEVDWSSSATFFIRAIDVNGNESGDGTLVASISTPGAVSIAHQFKDSNLVLNWIAPALGSLPIVAYEVRDGATFASATVVGTTSDRSYSIPVNWASTKTFWVVPIDSAGNYGVPANRVVPFNTYQAVTGLSASISQANLTLTWQFASGGSLPVKYYDIRHGSTWATGEVITSANTTSITLPITWIGTRRIWVTAVDSNDSFGASTAYIDVAVTAPSALSVASSIVVAKAELVWSPPSSTLPIREYEIRYGTTFEAGVLVATTLATNYRVPIDWIGNRTFWVSARDVSGNLGAASSATVSIAAPTAPTIDGGFNLDQFKLDWTIPTATLPIDEYEVRYGSTWASAAVLGRVKGTTISTKAQWVGAQTWWVAAIDVNGNVGAQGQRTFTISAPSAPGLSQQVVDNNVLLSWSASVGTLPIVTYDVRRGPAWETATSVGQKSGGFTTVFETVAGLYTYWVAGIDSAGNVGTPASVVTRVDQPPDYILQLDRNSDFNGRNFEFSAAGDPEGWQTAGATASVSGDSLVLTSTGADPMLIRSLTNEFFYGCERPVVVMRIRRVAGTGWQGDLYYETPGHTYSESFKKTVPVGPSIGQTLTLVWDMNTLTAGGADWMNSRINSVRFDLGTTAADVFEIEFIRFHEYTGTNALLGDSNTILLPVNTTETFAQHFTSRGWDQPSDQIAAGFPLFIQPTTTPGVFTQVIDYGTVLAATKVTVTPGYVVVAGSPTVSFKISVRATTSDAWTDYVDTQSIYASGFRYVKIEMTVSNSNQLGLIRLNNINVKFDSKLKNSAGMGSAGATDAVSGVNAVVNGVSVTNVNPNNNAGVRVPDGPGTLVRFPVNFVDVASIEVTVAAGGSARYGLYDFVDVANPAGFKVVLYDDAGTRVGGNFSWSVKGY